MSAGKATPNTGQMGVESIRLGGMKVDDLPIGEAARAKMQLPEAEKAARQKSIEDIKARYPTQSVEYLRARILEAKKNIARFREESRRIGSDREQYRMLLYDARERDKKIKAAEERLEGKDLEEEIKALTKECPWQIDAMKKQVRQFEESIERFEKTIVKEQKSVDELTELLGQCQARDKELARLGA